MLNFRLRSRRLTAYSMTAVMLISSIASAQRPPMRRHTVNKKGKLVLVEANQDLKIMSQVSTSEANGYRVLEVNGIPEHKVGPFPNRGNPHVIEPRVATFRLTLNPRIGKVQTPVELGMNFGIAINGVLFDPGAAEFWQGNPQSGWQYEALSGSIPLGLDTNFAHVQPDGKYHYHGIPTGLLRDLHFTSKQHSPLIGWGADGFPIYATHGYQDPNDSSSRIVELKPSYRLKKGRRPGGLRGDLSSPGGSYDGTFVNDYEFIEGLGDLDECNGRVCVTPEYPDGTYAYFLTEDWPSIPRLLRGEPDPSFRKHPSPPRDGRFGPPPRGAKPGDFGPRF
ncbi:YHYH protein [bacterium]|nr:YHYH protein [bacterium]